MKTSQRQRLKALCTIFTVAFLLTACESTGQKKVSPPDGTISSKKAMTLNQNYTKTRYKVINDNLGSSIDSGSQQKKPSDTVAEAKTLHKEFMDNRSNWWSIKDLEAYIAYARQEARKNNYVLDGLRIYQGAYSDTLVKGKTQIGLSTLFIVPTGKKAVGQQGNMIPMNKAEGSADIQELRPLNDGHVGNPPHAGYPQN